MRDAREAGRDARQHARATRAADFGVWFNTRAAQGVANGLVIADLATQGVFSTAGFREGDRIVSINGQPVKTEAEFVQLLTVPKREQVTVVVVRDGQQQTIVLQPTVLTQGIVNDDPFYQYGIVIDDRNPNQIVVLRVFPRTPAFYAGLRSGDIITGLAGQPIRNIQAFTTALQQADDTLALQVTRGGQTRELDLDVSTRGSVRTALRPNLDAQGRPETRRDGGTAPGTAAPGATKPGTTLPGTPATRPTPPTPSATPTRPVPPGTPTSPALPRTPVTPGGAPAATPGAPKAVPSAPTAPAAPRAGADAAGGAGAAAGTGTPKTGEPKN